MIRYSFVYIGGYWTLICDEHFFAKNGLKNHLFFEVDPLQDKVSHDSDSIFVSVLRLNDLVIMLFSVVKAKFQSANFENILYVLMGTQCASAQHRHDKTSLI